jgi:hypothetical protein
MNIFFYTKKMPGLVVAARAATAHKNGKPETAASSDREQGECCPPK